MTPIQLRGSSEVEAVPVVHVPWQQYVAERERFREYKTALEIIASGGPTDADRRLALEVLAGGVVEPPESQTDEAYDERDGHA